MKGGSASLRARREQLTMNSFRIFYYESFLLILTMSQFLVLFFYIQCLLETFGVLLNLFYMYSRCLIKIWYETFCHSFIKKTDLRISDDLRKSGKEWHHTFRDSSSIIGSEGPEGGWGNQIDLPPWEKHQKHLRAMGLMTP